MCLILSFQVEEDPLAETKYELVDAVNLECSMHLLKKFTSLKTCDQLPISESFRQSLSITYTQSNICELKHTI